MTERLQTCFLLSLAIAIMGVQIGVVKDSPFRLDDVRQIPVWRDKLREELGLSKLPEATVQAQDRGRFRPLLWLHFGLISRLQHGSTGAREHGSTGAREHGSTWQQAPRQSP